MFLDRAPLALELTDDVGLRLVNGIRSGRTWPELDQMENMLVGSRAVKAPGCKRRRSGRRDGHLRRNRLAGGMARDGRLAIAGHDAK